MKLSAVAAFAALGVAVSGCASIVEGTTQSVAVVTPPTDGAGCTLINSEGTWYLKSPGNVTVHKTKNTLTVKCKKDGYQDASIEIEPHFNGATAGNIIAGGIIGMGVDAATGANYNYPTAISVPMTATAAPAAAAAPSASAPAPASASPAS